MRYGFAQTLREELGTWVAEGLVTREQAEAIGARYAVEEREGRRGGIVQVLAVLGAIVAGLGVILFFAANWDALSRPFRVALLLAALLGAYGGGYALAFARATRPRVGHALLLLGGLLFGASIFLVGQMYHVQAHDPFAFLLWTAGVAPTALVVRSRPLAALAILTFGAWGVHELVVGTTLDAEALVPVVAALYGTALYALGTGLPRIDAVFAGPMRALGFTFAAAGAFVFTFRAVHGEVGDIALGGGLTAALVGLALAAGAGCVALALVPGRRTAAWQAAVLGALVLLTVLAVLAPEAAPDGRAVLYPLLFNLVLAALALGAVAVGYLEDELWLVNAGLVVAAVQVFARYVDFATGYLPRSLVFVGAGVVLLLVAFALERSRSHLRSRMEAS